MDFDEPFDVGPLTWVKPEVDLALQRAQSALQAYRASAAANKPDYTQFRFCRTHLHQVHGALSMMDLDGITQITAVQEQLLDALEEQKIPATEATLEALQSGNYSLEHYLDGLLSGEQPQPISLTPALQTLEKIVGITPSQPAALFFPKASPKLSWKNPPPEPPEQKQQKIKDIRTSFQQGLLAWMQFSGKEGAEEQKKVAAGIDKIRGAFQALSDISETLALHEFWRIATGFCYVLNQSALLNKKEAQRLCTLFDAQIRKMLQSSFRINERQQREILYYLALMPDGEAPLVDQLRQDYQLARYHLATPRPIVSANVQQQLIDLSAQCRQAEVLWGHYVSGSMAALTNFADSCERIVKVCHDISQATFDSLAGQLGEFVHWLERQTSGMANHAAAVEVVCILRLLILGQLKFSELSDASSPFAARYAQTARDVEQRIQHYLRDAQDQLAEPDPSTPLLHEIFHQGKVRLSSISIARKIQGNLLNIEQLLDSYFRDSQNNENLAVVIDSLGKIEQEFNLIHKKSAAGFIGVTREKVSSFKIAGNVPTQKDFALLARDLSRFGFYVDALLAGNFDADFDEYVKTKGKPSKASTTSDSPAAGTAGTTAAAKKPRADSSGFVSSSIGYLSPEEAAPLLAIASETTPMANMVDDLFESNKPPGGEPPTTATATASEETAETAAVTAAPSTTESTTEKPNFSGSLLRKRSKPAADAAGDASQSPPTTIPPAPASTTPAVERVQDVISEELVQIFIEEATSIVARLEEYYQKLLSNGQDLLALKDFDRELHTLKGSGRIVGLKEFSALAGSFESVVAEWLQLTPFQLTFMHTAYLHSICSMLRQWLKFQQDQSSAAPNFSTLLRNIPQSLPPAAEQMVLESGGGQQGEAKVLVVHLESGGMNALQTAPKPAASDADRRQRNDRRRVNIPNLLIPDRRTSQGRRGRDEVPTPAPAPAAPQRSAGNDERRERVDRRKPDSGIGLESARDRRQGDRRLKLAGNALGNPIPASQPPAAATTTTTTTAAPAHQLSVSPALLDIFNGEALYLLQVMRQSLQAWLGAPTGETPKEMIRAAHTLAGSTATVGLTELSQLARTLEHTLENRNHQSLRNTPLAVIEAAVRLLQEGITSASRADCSEMIKQLSDTYRVIPIAAPVITPPPTMAPSKTTPPPTTTIEPTTTPPPTTSPPPSPPGTESQSQSNTDGIASAQGADNGAKFVPGNVHAADELDLIYSDFNLGDESADGELSLLDLDLSVDLTSDLLDDLTADSANPANSTDSTNSAGSANTAGSNNLTDSTNWANTADSANSIDSVNSTDSANNTAAKPEHHEADGELALLNSDLAANLAADMFDEIIAAQPHKAATTPLPPPTTLAPSRPSTTSLHVISPTTTISTKPAPNNATSVTAATKSVSTASLELDEMPSLATLDDEEMSHGELALLNSDLAANLAADMFDEMIAAQPPKTPAPAKPAKTSSSPAPPAKLAQAEPPKTTPPSTTAAVALASVPVPEPASASLHVPDIDPIKSLDELLDELPMESLKHSRIEDVYLDVDIPTPVSRPSSFVPPKPTVASVTTSTAQVVELSQPTTAGSTINATPVIAAITTAATATTTTTTTATLTANTTVANTTAATKSATPLPTPQAAQLQSAQATLPPEDIDIIGIKSGQVDPQMFEFFCEEAGELLADINGQIAKLKTNVEDADSRKGLMRSLHTFKGAARMIGAVKLGDRAHQIETNTGKYFTGVPVELAHLKAIQLECDLLALTIERMQQHDSLPNANVPLVVKTIIQTSGPPPPPSTHIAGSMLPRGQIRAQITTPNAISNPTAITTAAVVHAPITTPVPATSDGSTTRIPPTTSIPTTAHIPETTSIPTTTSVPTTASMTATTSIPTTASIHAISSAHVSRIRTTNQPIQLADFDQVGIKSGQVDAVMFGSFYKEAINLIGVIDQHLESLRYDPISRTDIRGLKRALQILKGAARTVGAVILGEHILQTEQCLSDYLEHPPLATVELLQIQQDNDYIACLLELMQQQANPTKPPAPISPMVTTTLSVTTLAPTTLPSTTPIPPTTVAPTTAAAVTTAAPITAAPTTTLAVYYNIPKSQPLAELDLPDILMPNLLFAELMSDSEINQQQDLLQSATVEPIIPEVQIAAAAESIHEPEIVPEVTAEVPVIQEKLPNPEEIPIIPEVQIAVSEPEVVHEHVPDTVAEITPEVVATAPVIPETLPILETLPLPEEPPIIPEVQIAADAQAIPEPELVPEIIPETVAEITSEVVAEAPVIQETLPIPEGIPAIPEIQIAATMQPIPEPEIILESMPIPEVQIVADVQPISEPEVAHEHVLETVAITPEIVETAPVIPETLPILETLPIPEEISMISEARIVATMQPIPEPEIIPETVAEIVPEVVAPAPVIPETLPIPEEIPMIPEAQIVATMQPIPEPETVAEIMPEVVAEVPVILETLPIPEEIPAIPEVQIADVQPIPEPEIIPEIVAAITPEIVETAPVIPEALPIPEEIPIIPEVQIAADVQPIPEPEVAHEHVPETVAEIMPEVVAEGPMILETSPISEEIPMVPEAQIVETIQPIPEPETNAEIMPEVVAEAPVIQETLPIPEEIPIIHEVQMVDDIQPIPEPEIVHEHVPETVAEIMPEVVAEVPVIPETLPILEEIPMIPEAQFVADVQPIPEPEVVPVPETVAAITEETTIPETISPEIQETAAEAQPSAESAQLADPLPVPEFKLNTLPPPVFVDDDDYDAQFDLTGLDWMNAPLLITETPETTESFTEEPTDTESTVTEIESAVSENNVSENNVSESIVSDSIVSEPEISESVISVEPVTAEISSLQPVMSIDESSESASAEMLVPEIVSAEALMQPEEIVVPEQTAEIKPDVSADETVLVETMVTIADETAHVEPVATVADEKISDIPAKSSTSHAGERSSMLRVQSEKVDELTFRSGEMTMAFNRSKNEVTQLKYVLGELGNNVSRMRRHLGELSIQATMQKHLIAEQPQQFDPLEVEHFSRLQETTQLLAESIDDIANVEHTLSHEVGETQESLLAQGQINRNLQDDIQALRVVPFSSLNDRLNRLVRVTAYECHKTVQLVLNNQEQGLDRNTLEHLLPVLEHLIRNSIVHGIETTEERLAADKAAEGTITITLYQQGNEIQIQFYDDGRGIDVQKIAERAATMGITPPPYTDHHQFYMNLIFMSGFSTAEEITQLAGRGVGLDVVNNEIQTLGGRVSVSNRQGGACFSINLPFNQALLHALILRVSDQYFAISSNLITQVLDLKSKDIPQLQSNGLITWHGHDYPLYFLPRLLADTTSSPEIRPHGRLILVTYGAQRLALHVDQILTHREILVKPIAKLLPNLSHTMQGIEGASILDQGNIALIINPIHLLLRTNTQQNQTLGLTDKPVTQAEFAESFTAEHVTAKTPAVTQHKKSKPVVLAIDDSLTVRKYTCRFLERAGYEAVAARDGDEALYTLEQMSQLPCAILCDVDMPKRDGFDFLRSVKSHPKLQKLPVLMITSRTSQKHQDLAFELGASQYMGKPYIESELLELLDQYAEYAQYAEETQPEEVAA